MKVEEAMDTVAKFFNDLIGAWVPGAVLVVGMALMHLGPLQLQAILKSADSGAAALTGAGLLFAMGHALLAVYEHGVRRLLARLSISKKFDESEAKKRQSFVWFAELVKAQQLMATRQIGATTTSEAWRYQSHPKRRRWADGSCSFHCYAMELGRLCRSSLSTSWPASSYCQDCSIRMSMLLPGLHKF